MNHAQWQKAETRAERCEPRRQGRICPTEWLLAALAVAALTVFVPAQADTSPESSSNGENAGSPHLFDAIAMGPVEEVTAEPSGILIRVLGQTFLASPSAGVPAVGDYVVAAGRDGTLSILLRIDSAYIPGSSPVAARGQITSVDPSIASLSVGSLALDYSPALSSNSSFLPSEGQVIEFTGTQPALGGVTVVDSVQGIHGSGLQGIHGSGLQGIHGSGLQGIHGSGLQGIHGSGLQGIHGSGLQGIHGSGLQGIHGSGLQGIHGSGLQGIHGSGLQGIHGSGLQGIHGSGLQGIHGSGLQGIHGSGLQGIHGSGLQGIHGSGLK